MVSPAQLRAARALLDLSQAEVAAAAGLSLPTVKRAEAEQGRRVSEAAYAAIRRALEEAGAVFLTAGETVDGGPGVRLRRDDADGIRPEELNAANDG